MRVSTRVEYGLMALVDIAIHSDNGESVSTTEIADRQGISQKYLEQILPLLRQAKLIKAQKGLRGGYRLMKPAEEVSLAEILNALDDSILAPMEVQKNEGNDALRSCLNDCIWKKINEQLAEFAKHKTLGEFLVECRGKLANGWDLYII